MQTSANSTLCEGRVNFVLRKAILNTEPGAVATALNVQDAQGQEFNVLT